MFTKDRHFQYGYDDKIAPLRLSPQQNFFVRPGQCLRMPFDFRAETQIAARQIFQTFGDSLLLCLSGGLDSEIMAEAFYYSNTPFRAAIMRMANDKNIHDISWAVTYCESRFIPYEFIDVDVDAFFKSGEYLEFAHQSQCGFPFILLHLKLIKNIWSSSRVPIFGEGNMHFRRTKNIWAYNTQEFWYAHEKYCHNRSQTDLVKFYHWSPELMAAYISGPRFLEFIREQPESFQDLNHAKWSLYNDYYQCAERPKYRGYEKLMDVHLEYMETLKQKFNFTNQVAVLPLENLIKLLYPKEKRCGLSLKS